MISYRTLAAAAGLFIATSAAAQTEGATAPDGRLFHAPLDTGYVAAQAAGLAVPVFVDQVTIVPDGVAGGAARGGDNGVMAWSAPGNLYAQRGTLSFFWRSHQPIGRRQFVIFRAGYPDHTSWDMTFLRLDWNGHGFDAFVTDANLSRVRVSFDAPAPDVEAWTHFALAWDETKGLTLYVDGKPAAKTEKTAVLDNGLYAFGQAGRIISGYQVQNAYDWQRGGDVDEVSTFDRMLTDADVAALAERRQPAEAPVHDVNDAAVREAWNLRYGFNRPNDPPPYLAAPSTMLRVVRATEARDLNELFSKGDDGLRESTWPGVYNRSRLPGRTDYFILPDWNVYETGGRALTLSMPDQPWNRIEIQGAADGTLTHIGVAGETRIGTRAQGQERTTLQLTNEATGGAIRFDNRLPETPIREIGVYDVRPADPPAGSSSLSYVVRSGAPPTYPTLSELTGYIAGRFTADERATVVALPAGAPQTTRPAATTPSMPLVHVLIPADFRDIRPGGAPARFSYGWDNMRDGLDGIALSIPALTATPTHGDLIPLNIRIKDPLWPDRDLLDINVSVKAGEARTLWLDTRDRILPNDRSLYMTVASASPDFGAASLDGMGVRLVFKPRAEAAVEHVADRERQVSANAAWFVEEQPNNRLLPVYERFDRDIADLLRVDPDNVVGRLYWAEQNPEQPYPSFAQAEPIPGIPLWAQRQIEDLRQVEHFVNWWIDHRQINGEFGGGLSDDSDLLNQWPGLALMGADPDKIRDSQAAALDAIYRSDMMTNGLNTIRADELHSYEEGINTVAQYAQLNWGSPRAIEQLMATARRYGDLTEVNPAGHRHFVSNSFASDDMWRDGPWQRQKGNNFLIFQPGILLVQWNGNPTTRDLILQTADGFMAHGVATADGSGVNLPSQIDWPTDQVFGASGFSSGAGGAGLGGSTSTFLAAYRWTGDARYLAPLMPGGIAGMAALGPDMMSELDKSGEWGPGMIAMAEAASTGSTTGATGARLATPLALSRFGAWQITGDTRFLAQLYEDEIQSSTQRMRLMTTDEWWTDRVTVPSEMLQRSRLGGVASRRGQTMPGHVITWRFGEGDSADSVAILVSGATRTGFKVIAYNLEEHPVQATLRGAEVTPGQWRVTQGIDADNDGSADATQSSDMTFEPDAEVALTLAPRQATVLEFSLTEAGAPMSSRPDVGLDPSDVRINGRRAEVTVHSLGGVDAPAGEVIVETADGRVVGRQAFAALPAPADLLPKTTTVRVALTSGSTSGLRVRLVLAGDPAEINWWNNVVALP
ncbi:LamG-like jellyroll fold domain-containing protein [Brevundimonas sp. SL161]|uniref:LamG-like jellyroll fold domain-containing protein n=1 Tax=Brevundimonas sp. SL161 TaxID=2804613 RepID=UPI003CEF4B1F